MYIQTFEEESLSSDPCHSIKTGVTAIYEGAEERKNVKSFISSCGKIKFKYLSEVNMKLEQPSGYLPKLVFVVPNSIFVFPQTVLQFFPVHRGKLCFSQLSGLCFLRSKSHFYLEHTK